MPKPFVPKYRLSGRAVTVPDVKGARVSGVLLHTACHPNRDNIGLPIFVSCGNFALVRDNLDSSIDVPLDEQQHKKAEFDLAWIVAREIGKHQGQVLGYSPTNYMRGNAPTLIGCHGISDSLQPLDQVYEVRCSTWGVVKGCKDRWVVGCTNSLILGILWHDLYVQRVGCGKLNFAEKYALHQQIRESLEKTYTIRPDLWTEMADCVAISCNLAETTLGLKKLAAARLAGAQAPAPAVQGDAAEQAEPDADAEAAP